MPVLFRRQAGSAAACLLLPGGMPRMRHELQKPLACGPSQLVKGDAHGAQGRVQIGGEADVAKAYD
ncbi:hypothetical protein LIP_2393 [Limnochorda pilosa]|uniref:Uncharacterized protein n=1 Tax=Limnochorda pilosa TaxID=1555112 RepID=A0A0K2SN43_LIMPI|nr:hypothetical protein LIP_2393 [Limnochorda pilosa]